MTSSYQRIGLRGELRVLEFFVKNNIPACHANLLESDIICTSSVDRPIRVQVKTTVSSDKANKYQKFVLSIQSYYNKREENWSKKQYKKNTFDILACCILDTYELFFITDKQASELVKGKNHSITISDLRELIEIKDSNNILTQEEAWNSCVKDLYPAFLISEGENDGGRFNNSFKHSSECIAGQLRQGVLI